MRYQTLKLLFQLAEPKPQDDRAAKVSQTTTSTPSSSKPASIISKNSTTKFR